jgi:tRNA-modifying protein YgfZ
MRASITWGDLGDARFLRPDHLVLVEGPDAAAFLQGQLSQDVSNLEVGGVAWALLLEPDGRLGSMLRVLRTGPARFELLGGTGKRCQRPEEIAGRLERFKIRTKAAIAVVELERCSALPLPGDGRLVLEGLVVGSAAPVGLAPAGLGSDALARTVSFSKGCYTGQELVARMDARQARAPRRLAFLRGHLEQRPHDVDVSGLEGAEPTLLVGDAATGRVAGFVELPRSTELMPDASVLVDGVAFVASDLS